ncbi:YgfZ/GcvT domain-containing protein [Candidatus Poriferisocius sp.]|uniref:CAF17-like 4Fe-4S cluster assembly/insertion protein YgfZ n=1 Tax=Candidatus Poriferisocius sp. TaxID=3101276 RepID=UPI003B024975
MMDSVDLSTTVGAGSTDRGVLAVTGPDAEEFLQGQLSQDVAALIPGQSAWSLILQPQGRIDAFVRVTRQRDDRFVLDTDGSLEQVIARLQRFMLRTDVTLEPLNWQCIALRGPGAAEAAVAGEVIGPVPTGGVDVLGPAPAVSKDVPTVDSETLEAHRIRCGFPRMGVDIDDRTIPAEAEVVAFTVSFTKGCFTGQELVARMDSRGGTAPRYLRLLSMEGRVGLASGEPITGADGADIGTVTSAAWDAIAGATVALGYIKRAVEMPAEVRVAGCSAHAAAVPR